MTLRRFIIFVFLTLDIGLFVQPYPFDPLKGALWIQACIFHCMQIVVVNKQIKPSVKDGEGDDVCVYKHKKDETVTPTGPKMPSDVTQSGRYPVFICGEKPRIIL